MVDGMRRPIANAHTWDHLQFMGAFGDSDAIHAVPDCALEAIPMGIPINYMEEDEEAVIERETIVKGGNFQTQTPPPCAWAVHETTYLGGCSDNCK